MPQNTKMELFELIIVFQNEYPSNGQSDEGLKSIRVQFVISSTVSINNAVKMEGMLLRNTGVYCALIYKINITLLLW